MPSAKAGHAIQSGFFSFFFLMKKGGNGVNSPTAANFIEKEDEIYGSKGGRKSIYKSIKQGRRLLDVLRSE